MIAKGSKKERHGPSGGDKPEPAHLPPPRLGNSEETGRPLFPPARPGASAQPPAAREPDVSGATAAHATLSSLASSRRSLASACRPAGPSPCRPAPARGGPRRPLPSSGVGWGARPAPQLRAPARPLSSARVCARRPPTAIPLPIVSGRPPRAPERSPSPAPLPGPPLPAHPSSSPRPGAW